MHGNLTSSCVAAPRNSPKKRFQPTQACAASDLSNVNTSNALHHQTVTLMTLSKHSMSTSSDSKCHCWEPVRSAEGGKGGGGMGACLWVH